MTKEETSHQTLLDLQISPVQRELIKDTVLITGAPRSGTTLVGKIIGSLSALEYQFEPPSFYMISALYAAGQLPLPTAASLLAVYLCEDLLLETVQGRRANLRPGDDSMILNRMSRADLNRRWVEMASRSDVLKWIREGRARLAIKMPNVLDSIALFEYVMPDIQIVLVVRDGYDVVRSIAKKGWLTDEGLRSELWPYAASTGAVSVPYWLPASMHNRWQTMTPETRACVMWTHHAELGHQLLCRNGMLSNRLHLIRYEELIAQPETIVSRVAEALGHEVTAFTRRRIEEIRPPVSAERQNRTEIFDQVDPDVRERFVRANSAWGYEIANHQK